jgi:voltage-gated potassium channel
VAEPEAGRHAAGRRLALSLLLFVLVVVGGTITYMQVEGAGWLEALYLTIITVTSVGFEETIALDRSGWLITIVIIILGVGSVTLATVHLVEFLVAVHLRDLVGRRRMERQLHRLEGHTIVCGYGRVGQQVAGVLHAEHRPVVVVEVHQERAAQAGAEGLPYVLGNAGRDEVLEEAGLERATGLAAVTDDDAENILVALTAKGRNPALFVVVRVQDMENEPKARRAGADRVIAPSTIGGRRIAALLTRPTVVEFLDVVTGGGGSVDLVLEEVPIGERSSLVGMTLRQADVRQRHGATVLAVRPANGTRLTTQPDPERPLERGDVLVVMGGNDEVTRFRAAQAGH